MKTSTSTANSLRASIKSRLKKADFLVQDGEPEEAIHLLTEVLDDDLNNPHTLFILSRAFHDLKRPGMAAALGRVCVEGLKLPESWTTLGLCYQMGFDLKAAKECFLEALKLDRQYYPAIHNLAVTCQYMCEVDEGMEWATEAHFMNQRDFAPIETMGFLNLIQQNFTPGWSQYNQGMGHHKDREKRFPMLPDWDGTKGRNIVLYSEQGLGDEICFTQYVPELMKDCNIVIETCQTMYNLFKTSFGCPVYPTHFLDKVEWFGDHKLDAKLSFSEGMEMYRDKKEKFTGKPHLRASEEKRKMWRAILSNYPRKKVGIAWKAGITETGKINRTIDPMDMLPIFKGMDATFVCLEYKDPTEDLDRLKAAGVDVLNFSNFINGNKDYEHTAALVSELDHVIAPTTTIVDLCGGLGKSCDALVPERPFWRYAGGNVWYNSVKWVHQKGSWADTIQKYMKEGKC